METVTDMIMPIVWVMIVFLPGFILNYFLPRIGFVVGIGITTVALWLGDVLPVWILFINLVGIIVILFRGSSTTGATS